jgi:hypothetical protein
MASAWWAMWRIAPAAAGKAALRLSLRELAADTPLPPSPCMVMVDER